MKRKHSWTEVDENLEKLGLIMFLGALSCLSLTPISGVLGTFALLLVAAHMHDDHAKQWRRNVLQAEMNNGSFSGSTFSELRTLISQLKQDQPKRNLFVAKVGYWTLVGVMLYQLYLCVR